MLTDEICKAVIKTWTLNELQCVGAVVCISPLNVVCLSKRSSQPGRWTQQPFFKSI